MLRTFAFASLFGLVMAMAFVKAALSRDIFVSNLSGSDRMKGEKPDPEGERGPVATINRALQLVRSGDRVVLANTGVPYREQIALSGSRLRGSEHRPLRIKGAGAVLDGTVVVPDGAWRHIQDDLFAFRPRRLTYQQVFHEGKPLVQVRLTAGETALPQLNPLQYALGQGRILLRVEKGHLPHDYAFRHAGLQTGITLYDTRHVVIEDLVIQGYQQDGLNAHELVRDCVLRRVECRANGRSGLSVGGVSRLRVERSNFYDNGRAQVRVAGLSRVELTDCELDVQEDARKIELQGGELTIDGAPVRAGNELLR